MEKEENKISQNQFYDLITGEEVSWQAVIYDLIKTEQLDPWNIDIAILADKYLEIIKHLEEANFLISSKVLLACALLLRLKSEILTNNSLRNLDEAMYGKKEEKKYVLDRIDIDEDELPFLVPRTPIPRFKKVTLKELMFALNKAIETERRRIRKDIAIRQIKKDTLSLIKKENRVSLKDRISEVLMKINKYFEDLSIKEITFHELAPTRQEKLAIFLPILHLDHNEKIYIMQHKHFNEILIQLEKHEMMEELEFFEESIENLSSEQILEGDKFKI